MDTGWPPPELFVTVMMTQATGCSSASNLYATHVVKATSYANWECWRALSEWKDKECTSYVAELVWMQGLVSERHYPLSRCRSMLPLNGRSSPGDVALAISMQVPPRYSPLALLHVHTRTYERLCAPQ